MAAADLDFLAHIDHESTRFADALRAADPGARVPTCPDWNAEDLLYHLAEVFAFWATIAREHLDDPDEAEARKPARPAGRDELFALFGQSSRELLDTLRDADLDAPIWTWTTSSDVADHSVRFVPRRMAQEALIHRLDAELTAGALTDVDPALADDGVHEVLKLFLGYRPEWAEFTADGPLGRLRATDTGSDWLVRVRTWSATSPNTGTTYTDEQTLEVVDEGTPSFTLSAPARDLDAWLWSRPTLGEIDVADDRGAFDTFAAFIARRID